MKRPAVVLVGIVFFLGASNLLVSSVLGLGDAEALYYCYSRHLSLSYLDHPPLIGWLIRLSTAVIGPEVLGVRLVPMAMTVLCLIVAYSCTAEMFGQQAAALCVLLLFASPVFSIGMMAASPDAPLAALALLSTRQLYRAIKDDTQGAVARIFRPALLGLLVGLAFLAKYTGACLVLSVIAVLYQRQNRRFLKYPGFYLGAAAAAASAVPVFVWNSRHGWVGMLHRLVYTQGEAGFSLRNVGALIGGQLLYVGPFVIMLMGLAISACFRSKAEKRAEVVLLAVSLPILTVTYLLGCWSKVAEPHWPAAGYLPLYPLAAGYLVKTGRRRLFRWAVGFGAAVFLIAHFAVLTPLLPRFVQRPLYEPKYDLANELRGWDEVATLVRRINPEKKPVVAAFYTQCSQLAFHLNREDDPPVRCVSETLTDFDIWYGKFVLDDQGALFITDNRFDHDPKAVLENARIGDKTSLLIERGGITVRVFTVWGADKAELKKWAEEDKSGREWTHVGFP